MAEAGFETGTPVAIRVMPGLSNIDGTRTGNAARTGEMKTLRKVCKLSACEQQVTELIEVISKPQR